MAVGLKIRDALGRVRLEITDKLTRLRYTATATAGNNGNITLADIAGKKTLQFAVPLDSSEVAHKVERSGTTISWTAQTNGLWSSGDSLVIVFLYT